MRSKFMLFVLYVFLLSSFVVKAQNDPDGDGIKGRKDKCPEAAENFNGYLDKDGCPEDDEDGDGMPDLFDKCKYKKGPKEYQGCPEAYYLEKKNARQEVFSAYKHKEFETYVSGMLVTGPQGKKPSVHNDKSAIQLTPHYLLVAFANGEFYGNSIYAYKIKGNPITQNRCEVTKVIEVKGQSVFRTFITEYEQGKVELILVHYDLPFEKDGYLYKTSIRIRRELNTGKVHDKIFYASKIDASNSTGNREIKEWIDNLQQSHQKELQQAGKEAAARRWNAETGNFEIEAEERTAARQELDSILRSDNIDVYVSGRHVKENVLNYDGNVDILVVSSPDYMILKRDKYDITYYRKKGSNGEFTERISVFGKDVSATSIDYHINVKFKLENFEAPRQHDFYHYDAVITKEDRNEKPAKTYKYYATQCDASPDIVAADGIMAWVERMQKEIQESIDRKIAQKRRKELIEKRKLTEGRIGISINSKTKIKGAVIDEVVINSPAHKAGIAPYDKIVSINGKKVKSKAIRSGLRGRVGSKVTIGYKKGNALVTFDQVHTVTLTREKISFGADRIKAEDDPGEVLINLIGQNWNTNPYAKSLRESGQFIKQTEKKGWDIWSFGYTGGLYIGVLNGTIVEIHQRICQKIYSFPLGGL